MNLLDRRGRTVYLLAACAPVFAAAGVAVSAAPAQAATHSVTGQYQYTCQIAESDKPSSTPIMTSGMQLSMQLNVPTAVRPGQRVDLRGTLSLQFPEELATYAKSLVNTANGYSDTISVALTMNGKTTVFRADRWQTPNVKVSNPLVVRAPLSFPAFTVPEGSVGSISLAMPRDNVVKNPYFASPSPVAFTAAAQASGVVLNANFYLACAGASKTPTFASIPISAKAVSKSARAEPQAGGAGQPETTATRPPPAVADGDDTDPFGASPASDESATMTGDAGLTDSSANAAYSQSDGQGVYVPGGVLVALGVLICLGSLAFAAWTQYRLHVLRAALDD